MQQALLVHQPSMEDSSYDQVTALHLKCHTLTMLKAHLLFLFKPTTLITHDQRFCVQNTHQVLACHFAYAHHANRIRRRVSVFVFVLCVVVHKASWAGGWALADLRCHGIMGLQQRLTKQKQPHMHFSLLVVGFSPLMASLKSNLHLHARSSPGSEAV